MKKTRQHVSAMQEAINAWTLARKNSAEAAKELGIPRTTLYDRVQAAKSHGIEPTVEMPVDEKEKPTWRVVETENEARIWSVGDSVLTVNDAIAKAGFDLKLWEIVEKKANSWPTSMKLATGSRKDGTHNEEPHQIWNWQITVKLRRKAPKGVQLGIQDLLKDLRDQPLKFPAVPKRKKMRDPHLLEISLYDAHFGKLCWGEETGTDYDLKIAESDYLAAVDDLLVLVDGYDIERVVLPVGNDFFQVNNWLGTTARGTQVDSTDDRFQKVFRCGARAIQHAVMRCREFASVEMPWIPGNHDPETSWYLTEYLSAVFAGDDRVRISNGPLHRKYMQYGTTLLGYAHGDTPKIERLPSLMASDVPQAWAASTWRAWRCGHLHAKKKIEFVTTGDTFAGVRIDILPSISGTDKWHYDHGFIRNPRAAEAWLWSRKRGYTGQFSVATRSQQSDWQDRQEPIILVA